MLRQFYIFSYKKHGHGVGRGRVAKYNYLCHSELSDSVIQIPRLKCDYMLWRQLVESRPTDAVELLSGRRSSGKNN